MGLQIYNIQEKPKPGDNKESSVVAREKVGMKRQSTEGF